MRRNEEKKMAFETWMLEQSDMGDPNENPYLVNQAFYAGWAAAIGKAEEILRDEIRKHIS